MGKQEKQKQLGMNPSTASQRLLKDILWSYVVKSGDDYCYVCKERMLREDFSIEHKEPWLHSDDPVGLFFDIDNISYSHKSCNYSNARKPNKVYENEQDRLKAKSKRKYWSTSQEVRKQKRREKYLRTGI